MTTVNETSNSSETLSPEELAASVCKVCVNPRIGTRSRAKYGAWGWFGLITGVGVLPKTVEYYCGNCGRIYGSTNDLDVREAHR